jgi:hypothetical protein
MQPYFRFIVGLGQWVQTHQEVVLAVCATVVIVLGVARVAWRSSSAQRRPWR